MYTLLPGTGLVVSSDASGTVRSIARGYADVYGALVGVGDGTADDVQIQAAIDALPVGGRFTRPVGKVILGEGTFSMAALIDLNPDGLIADITIQGMGINSTHLNLAFDGKMFAATRADNEVGSGGIYNLSADGKWASRTAGTFFEGMPYDFHFEGLRIDDFRDYGLDFSRGVGGGGYDRSIIIDKCNLQGCNVGIHSNLVNSCFVTRTSIGARTTAVVIEDTMLWFFFGCAFGTPFVAGGQFIKLLSTANPVSDIYFEGNFYDVSDSSSGTNALTAVIDFVGSNINEISLQGEKFWAQRSPAEAPTVIKIPASGTFLNLVLMDNEINYTVDETGVEFHPTKFLDAANLQGLVMWNNKLSHDGSAVASTMPTAGYTSIKNNRGYTTENSGTATVASGSTTKVVAHGLAAAPTRVLLTARLWSNAAKAWVTAIDATNFTINVDADPGAGTAIFDWRAQVGEG